MRKQTKPAVFEAIREATGETMHPALQTTLSKQCSLSTLRALQVYINDCLSRARHEARHAGDSLGDT